MNILAIIPARGNSKSIKLKNLQKINGKPLIEYTVNSAIKSKKITKIVVSSESKKILDFCKKKKLIIVKRPNYLSKDQTKTVDVVNHCTNYLKKKINYKPDLIVILQPTSPLRSSNHIDEAIEIFLKNTECDSLVSVQNVQHNFEPFSQMKINKAGFLENVIRQKQIKLRKQDKVSTYARNGAAIYITKKIYNLKSILYGKILPYKMPMISSIDIDDHEDLMLCKIILKDKKYKNVNKI